MRQGFCHHPRFAGYPVLRSLPPLYSTESPPLEEKRLIAPWFHLGSRWTGSACEGEWEDGDDGVPDFRMFGLVVGHETRVPAQRAAGYFLLSDLQSLGWAVERDEWFSPCPWGELAQKEGAAHR